MKQLLFVLAINIALAGCYSKEQANSNIATDQNLIHNNIKQLTEVIIHDMFSPPVSSRIYCYSSLAAYEAIKFDKPGYTSIAEKLHGFSKVPGPEQNKSYNFLLAATKAFFTVAEKITFSKDTLINYENKVYKKFRNILDEEIYNRSLSFGEAVGKKILERTTVDNYKETRGMEKFLGSNEPGKWRPTPPDYLDAGEPHWGKIMPLLADSSSQFSCPPPPVYDTSKKSNFYKVANEVYTIGVNLTDEQKTIARYWDDNPFVTEHAGHLMYGNKKITPVGHWIGITAIACKKKNANAVQSAQAYALTSVAMFDALISCWNGKFRYQLVRPVTVINELIDRNWQPFLQTPPFPEHSSGHSGISASAATVLTRLFGDNFAFEDTSELEYIGMKRNFSSFMQAANEASISRVYGGIHYRTGVDAGAVQGKKVGEYVINKFLSNSVTSLL
ncbi:MAG: vanadium-dependent haloperoxidase [Chitinophagaceae bacterium]|nr:vanadium-dependent haloperoxidase [Chitinophagaceae bacterium]